MHAICPTPPIFLDFIFGKIIYLCILTLTFLGRRQEGRARLITFPLAFRAHGVNVTMRTLFVLSTSPLLEALVGGKPDPVVVVWRLQAEPPT
jgi:hypothetical protein